VATPRKDFREVRDKFARDNGLPFGRLLTREYVLSVLADEGHYYKSRVFCPLVTLWGWLSQCLSQDKSLNEAVSRIVAHRVSSGLPACAATSSAYSEARMRFPSSAMPRMAKEIGRNVHDARDTEWDWHGRPVYLADGTTFSMPDTPENQIEWPQVATVKPGLGFPVMRSVALISLATGAVVDMGFAPYAGKGTGEGSLLRELMGSIPRGSVVVADKYYPSYFTVALLLERGIDLVSISHVGRVVNFDEGKILGPKDHIVTWHKPKYRSDWMDRESYDRLPDTIQVREFEIEIEGRNGDKEKAIVVTTIIDETVPENEISDLYWTRWNCELDIRSIKHSLHMDVLRCKTPDMIRKELWCHVLAWNLLRGVIVEAAKRHDAMPRQLSVKGAMQSIESFTPVLMAIDGNEAIYDAMLTTVSVHRVGNRPGRQEPRFKKRRPTWRKYMTTPRHQSKRRLAAEARNL
jgi:hypothetical protein